MDTFGNHFYLFGDQQHSFLGIVAVRHRSVRPSSDLSRCSTGPGTGPGRAHAAEHGTCLKLPAFGASANRHVVRFFPHQVLFRSRWKPAGESCLLLSAHSHVADMLLFCKNIIQTFKYSPIYLYPLDPLGLFPEPIHLILLLSTTRKVLLHVEFSETLEDTK